MEVRHTSSTYQRKRPELVHRTQQTMVDDTYLSSVVRHSHRSSYIWHEKGKIRKDGLVYNADI